MCVFSPLLQLTAATDRINSLREEQEQLKKENETILQSSQRKEEVWGGECLGLTAAEAPPDFKKE